MRLTALLPLLLLTAAPAAAQGTVCTTPPTPGRQQSPVDIRHATAARLQRLATHEPVETGRAFNTGHTVRVDVAPGDGITVDGVPFALVQFHFHWPAEHELAGVRYPVEIHMVHESADGTLAVLGTWVRAGAQNHAWDELWAHLPTGSDTVPVRVDVRRMFSLENVNAERVYRYCGSLTTEPYSEGVTWLMRRTTITLSPAQIERLHQVMHRYSRDVQPLNGRTIRYRPPAA
jgi:carbonic anhydrase